MSILYIILILILYIIFRNRKELFQNYKYKLPDSYAFPYYNNTDKSNYYEHPYYNLNRFHNQYYPKDIPEFDD